MDTSSKTIARPPLRHVVPLVAGWTLHWLFWAVVAWTALLWSPALGSIVAVIVVIWYGFLTYLAFRYGKVQLKMSDEEILSAGFFRRRSISRNAVASVLSAPGAPALAFVLLGPQLTGRSIYWMSGLLLKDGTAVWLYSLFARQKDVESQVRRIEQWLEQGICDGCGGRDTE